MQCSSWREVVVSMRPEAASKVLVTRTFFLFKDSCTCSLAKLVLPLRLSPTRDLYSRSAASRWRRLRKTSLVLIPHGHRLTGSRNPALQGSSSDWSIILCILWEILSDSFCPALLNPIDRVTSEMISSLVRPLVSLRINEMH